MSDLGVLLVLLHGARGRVSTVRATVRMWRHELRRREAMERSMGEEGVTAYAALDVENLPETAESVVRVWLAPPDRAREDREGADGASYGVRRGRLWWQHSPHSGAVSNVDRPEIGSGIGEELWWLLDPAPLIGVLDFHSITPCQRAERGTLRVRAVPRAPTAGDRWPLARLGADGADELLLDIDEERGALLRIETRFQGEPIVISEVVEIAFDEPFGDEVFEFTPPPGEDVRSIADEFAVERGLTIEQAVARAPFTVWIPARVPAGWETAIAFAAERRRPAMAPQVHLHYRAPDGMHEVLVAESPADHPGEHSDYEHARPNPWRQIVRADRPMQIREPAEDWQPAQVLLELDGTRIHMHSTNLAADRLADLAAGVVPAPSDPTAF